MYTIALGRILEQNPENVEEFRIQQVYRKIIHILGDAGVNAVEVSRYAYQIVDTFFKFLEESYDDDRTENTNSDTE